MKRQAEWLDRNIADDWTKCVTETNKLLQIESELEEIVKLVGYDSLSPSDRLILEASRSVREDYLQQNAFDDTDAYTSLDKQYRILKLILTFYNESVNALEKGVDVKSILKMEVREKIARAKYIPEDEIADYMTDASQELTKTLDRLIKEEVSA